MDMLILCAFALVTAVVGKAVEPGSRGIKLLLVMTASALIFAKTADFLSSVLAEIRSLYDQSGADPQYLRILLKTLGICYITSFTCGVCRDSGEETLASQTLLAGRIVLLVTALPLFEALTEIIRMLLV